jgi:hypothetical protein
MPVDEQATEEFLAHYGVRGMRWGVRNKSKKPKAKIFVKMTPEEKEKWKNSPHRKASAKKANVVLRDLGIGVASLTGASIFVDRQLKKHGADPFARVAVNNVITFGGGALAAKIIFRDRKKKVRR